MKPIQFNEANVIFAKDQPEYQPLPACKVGDENGTVVTCWELSEEEMNHLIKTRQVWFSVLSFNKPLVPMLPSVYKTDFFQETPELTESPIDQKE